ERIHAGSNGRRERSVVRFAEFVEDWGVTKLVSLFFDESRDVLALGAHRGKHGPPRDRDDVLTGARRWNEPIDGPRSRQRHAAKLWLSVLSAAERDLVFVGVCGNVGDVRACLSVQLLLRLPPAGKEPSTRSSPRKWGEGDWQRS